MIVNQNQRRGVQFKGTFDNLTWVDRNVVDCAFGLGFVGDKHIFAVKEKDTELFNIAMCHSGAAVADQGFPPRDRRFVEDARLGQTMRGGFHDFEFGYDRRANAGFAL